MINNNSDTINQNVYYIEKLKSMGYNEKQIREILRKSEYDKRGIKYDN